VKLVCSSLGGIRNYGNLAGNEREREKAREGSEKDRRRRGKDKEGTFRRDITTFFSRGAQFPVENSAKHNNDWR